jgi:hypothetical protein
LFYLSHDRYYYLAWFLTLLVCAVWLRDEGFDMFKKSSPQAAAWLMHHPLRAWFERVLDWCANVAGVTPATPRR